jgi:hypothetical protein
MLTLKIRAALCAMVALAFAGLVTGTARASTQYDYFEFHGYDDELRRCFEFLKPMLDVRDTDTVAWEVAEIDRRGPWYRFEIFTIVVDAEGDTVIDGHRAGCMANRWIPATRLIERDNTGLPADGNERLARNR